MTTKTHPADLIRSFRTTLQTKRDALAGVGASDLRTQKLLTRLDVVLSLTDDVYRGLLH